MSASLLKAIAVHTGTRINIAPPAFRHLYFLVFVLLSIILMKIMVRQMNTYRQLPLKFGIEYQVNINYYRKRT